MESALSDLNKNKGNAKAAQKRLTAFYRSICECGEKNP